MIFNNFFVLLPIPLPTMTLSNPLALELGFFGTAVTLGPLGAGSALFDIPEVTQTIPLSEAVADLHPLCSLLATRLRREGCATTELERILKDIPSNGEDPVTLLRTVGVLSQFPPEAYRRAVASIQKDFGLAANPLEGGMEAPQVQALFRNHEARETALARIASERKFSDRYEILTQIAKGGQAVVLLVRDRADGQEKIAKKLVGMEGWRRLMDEARAIISLRHPNIMEGFDLIVEPTGLHADVFLINEYLKGFKTLSQYIAERKRFTEEQIWEIEAQVTRL